MTDNNCATHGPQDCDPNPLLTKCDESGRPVQVIEPAGKPPTILFYGSGDAGESSEKENVVEGLDPLGV